MVLLVTGDNVRGWTVSDDEVDDGSTSGESG